MPTITLRQAVEEDLSTIYTIETEVYPVPWTPNFFRIIFHMNKDLFLVALDEDAIIGYVVGEIELMGKKSNPRKAGHVMNIAVKASYQGKGVGSMLLDEIEARFVKGRADVAYLEVRESNVNAQNVYKRRGYEYVRTAKDYYGDEDGFIMSKRLDH